MHGLLDSSGTYVLMGPNQGLAYMLADAGYDVWMGNVRGNRYSRKHELLNPDGNRPQRRQFFNFSWQEIGSLDLPAIIDYVLATNTAFKKLHYIGHSQGTTSFFVMASRRPEYNEKVLLMNALAPVAFMENLSSRFSRVLSRFQPLLQVSLTQIQTHISLSFDFIVNSLQASLSTLGIYEFRPGNSLTTQIQQYLCREEAVTADACQNLVFALLGFNPDLVDKVYYTRKPRPPMKVSGITYHANILYKFFVIFFQTKVPIIQQHAPAGAAVRQLVHYGQLMRRGSGFRAYDFGRIGNMQQHGSLTPPQYPLSQITAPVALHYGLKDDLAAVVDVKRLAAALPNLIELREVPHPDFDHISFVWGTEVRSLVYNHMLTLMKKAEQNQ